MAVLLFAFLSILIPGTMLSAPSAYAVGSFANSSVADAAENSPNGSRGGQCKMFGNNAVFFGSGQKVRLSGYHDGYKAAGGVEVTHADAVRGDIIQITPSGSTDATAESMYNLSNPTKRLHTAIIVKNNGGGNFDVIDSNFSTNNDELVRRHALNPYTWAKGSNTKIWRMGTVANSTPAPAPGTRLVGFVNNDNRADAVVMFRDTGTAMVAISNGNHFATPTSWASGHTAGADRYFLADVNGDALDDLVAFWSGPGMWRVSLSSGSGFWPEQEWAMGHGKGTSQQWVVNVNNDNWADVVTFDKNTGDWYVSASSKTGFWSPVPWKHGHGVGSTDQQLADFTSDGKADAGVWFANSGLWHVAVALPNGGFAAPGPWSNGHGLGSDKRLVGKASPDGLADVAYFFRGNGHLDVGTSSGGGFWAPTAWAHGHGPNTTDQFLADASGDGKADFISFDRGPGDWRVSTSSGTGFWAPGLWLSGHGANS